MEQIGLVTELRGDKALVNLQRREACASCGQCGFLSGANKKEIIVEALNPHQAAVGQCVMLESNDMQALLVSFVLYLAPALALVAGIAIVYLLGPVLNLKSGLELLAAGLGILLMLVVYLFARAWDRRIKDDPAYKPVITDILKETTPESVLISEQK